MKAALKATGLTAAAGFALSLALVPTQAQAATFVPCTSANNAAALRAAVAAGGEIALSSGCTYTLTGVDHTGAAGPDGLPVITGTVRISGYNTTITRAPTAASFRIFEVQTGGNLTLNSITVSGGYAVTDGGGIRNNGGAVTLNSGRVSGNSGTEGGGIWNAGNLTANSLALQNNTARAGNGGGLLNASGQAVFYGGSITGNSATDGGGSYEAGGSVAVYGTSFSGNTPNNCRPTGSVPGCPAP